jgi:hypothetical protein
MALVNATSERSEDGPNLVLRAQTFGGTAQESAQVERASQTMDLSEPYVGAKRGRR